MLLLLSLFIEELLVLMLLYFCLWWLYLGTFGTVNIDGNKVMVRIIDCASSQDCFETLAVNHWSTTVSFVGGAF